MPRIHPDLILPEILQLPIEAVLLRHDQRRDRLPGVFLRIPHLARVFHGLIVQVLAQLVLQEILRVVVAVEVLQPLGEDVRAVLVGLDGFVVEFLLRVAAGHEAVFRDIVAEAEGGLAVLARALEVGVADGVAESLQGGVRAGVEVFVELGLVVAVFDAQVDDLARGFRVGEIEGGGAVEFDVLRRDARAAGEEVAVDVEDFHGETTRLRDAVVKARVAGFGAVAADDGVFGAVVEHALFEMLGKIIVDDQFTFDDALGSGVGSFGSGSDRQLGEDNVE